ncbi:MAG: GTP cyclohydrolase II [Rhodothalassiaceae bacterium]
MSEPLVPTHLREAIAGDRAAADLRRAVPVILRGDGAALLVAPAELVETAWLERLRRVGRLRILLTRERAAVLKMPHKGRAAVAIAAASSMTAAAIRAIADPTRDLLVPLKGPFAIIDAEPRAIDLAALSLLRRARLLPAAVAVPLAEDRAAALAAECGLLLVDAAAIAAAGEETALRLDVVADARLPLADAPAGRLVAFRPADGGSEHFALLLGDPAPARPVLVRLHSECFTGDVLGSLKCDCGTQLREALRVIEAAGGGILLYLAQEGRGIGLVAKLKAYALQDQGFDTMDANLRLGFAGDERVFAPAAAMLRALGFSRVRLLTNNPDKVRGLAAAGIAVTERVPHHFPANEHNAHYLATKRDRSGHIL